MAYPFTGEIILNEFPNVPQGQTDLHFSNHPQTIHSGYQGHLCQVAVQFRHPRLPAHIPYHYLKKRIWWTSRMPGPTKSAWPLTWQPLSFLIKFRGKGVGGPHHWENTISAFKMPLPFSASAMPAATSSPEWVKRKRRWWIRHPEGSGFRRWTHLFSFFPEADSQMKDHPMPEMDQYRRIQLARYLMDRGAQSNRKNDF
jgi:hypothetical protein